MWIDKLILEVLSENKLDTLIDFLYEYPKEITEFIIKKIANKYKYWIEKLMKFTLLSNCIHIYIHKIP